MFLGDRPLESILPELASTPAVSIRAEDTLGEAATLLLHHLETFTDSLVVTSNDIPVGIVGGAEVLDCILKNHASGFLDKTKISDAMNKNLVIIYPRSKFSDLVNQWSQTRRAFAITPNKYHGYSAISARKILDIGTSHVINTNISAIPRKKIVTFHKDETIRQVIQRMFDNKTRKLVLDGTTDFINDRIIIQKMVREFDCLRDGRDFLQMDAGIFSTEKARIVPENTTVSTACSMMQEMKSPYLISNDIAISPWDMVLILGTAKTE
jgi:predicted transcriptional regulator